MKTRKTKSRRSQQRMGRPREKDIYRGIEYFACWLLDNREGETVTEELLRQWASDAWLARKNA